MHGPNAREGWGGGLAGLAATGAAAGFGLAAGMDAYALARRWWRPLLVAAFLAGTAWAAYDVVRGHRRSIARAATLTLGANALLAFASASVVCWVAPAWAAEVEVSLALAGALAGALVRPRRLRAFAVAAHNEDFLRRHGFVELGGTRGTVRDGAGVELVPFDRRRDAVVLERLDAPGRLARIALDGRGRMLSYEGAGEAWEAPRHRVPATRALVDLREG